MEKLELPKISESHSLEKIDKSNYENYIFTSGTKFKKEDIYICSSANGGLNTLIIGITNTYSLKYATNIAFNSGINIIDTVLYRNIEETSIPSE